MCTYVFDRREVEWVGLGGGGFRRRGVQGHSSLGLKVRTGDTQVLEYFVM